jgi:glycosyltransferase involved in cell wall biosynthesis
VEEKELDRLYRAAMCVVAPALDEDYGLTALEAMSYAKPVIVCRDGGGLTDLVEHRVTGLVVEPTGAAIAAAVDELTGDLQLRRELGENGRAVASRFTWERALAQVDEGIESAMAA